MSNYIVEVSLSRGEEHTEAKRFEKNSLMIGRASGNDICLDTPGVSRYHARLAVESGEISVEDVGSTNGTFVNSEKVNSRVLSPDDVVSIGSVMLKAKLIPSIQANPAIPVNSNLANRYLPDSEAKAEAEVAPPLAAVDEPEKEAEKHAEEKLVLENLLNLSEQRELQTEPKAEHSASGKSQSAELLNETSGLLPLLPYLNDNNIKRIAINSASSIYLDHFDRREKAALILDEEQFKTLLQGLSNFAERQNPNWFCATVLENWSVTCLLPPYAQTSPALLFERQEKLKHSGPLLSALDSFCLSFLQAAVRERKNIFLVGRSSPAILWGLSLCRELLEDDSRIAHLLAAEHNLEFGPNAVGLSELAAEHNRKLKSLSKDELLLAALSLKPEWLFLSDLRDFELRRLFGVIAKGSASVVAGFRALETELAVRLLLNSVEQSVSEENRELSGIEAASCLNVLLEIKQTTDHLAPGCFSVKRITECEASDATRYKLKTIFEK